MEIHTPKPTQVAPSLFIGSLHDYHNSDNPFSPHRGSVMISDQINSDFEWSILHAAKEPYHREFVDSEGRGAPKDDPEHFFAKRGIYMALNLVDAKDPAYIPMVVVNAGLEFIDEELKKGRKVFVHCNQGISRAPSFGLLWMVGAGLIEDVLTFESAMAEYKEKHYPAYEPGAGMAGFMKENWDQVYSRKRF